jgi:hypothetical protein
MTHARTRHGKEPRQNWPGGSVSINSRLRNPQNTSAPEAPDQWHDLVVRGFDVQRLSNLQNPSCWHKRRSNLFLADRGSQAGRICFAILPRKIPVTPFHAPNELGTASIMCESRADIRRVFARLGVRPQVSASRRRWQALSG